MKNIEKLARKYTGYFNIPPLRIIKKHRNYNYINKLYHDYLHQLTLEHVDLTVLDYARNGAYEGWVIMPGMNIETLYELPSLTHIQ